MDNERTRNSPVTFWFLAVLCALLAYVLSIGPMGYLTTHQYIPPQYSRYVFWFYAPLIAIGASVESFVTVYSWYMDLWGA